MKVKRIMSNTETSDLKKAAAFYGDVLGLDLIMDGFKPMVRMQR